MQPPPEKGDCRLIADHSFKVACIAKPTMNARRPRTSKWSGIPRIAHPGTHIATERYGNRWPLGIVLKGRRQQVLTVEAVIYIVRVCGHRSFDAVLSGQAIPSDRVMCA
jgi:hypothetical protein